MPDLLFLPLFLKLKLKREESNMTKTGKIITTVVWAINLLLSIAISIICFYYKNNNIGWSVAILAVLMILFNISVNISVWKKGAKY